MKAMVYARPAIELKLSAVDVELLLRCSKLHYDSACKDAGAQSGFLIGWQNMIKHGGADDEFNVFGATTRDLQICCKLLELPFGGTEEKRRSFDLFTELLAVLRAASSFVERAGSQRIDTDGAE